MSENLFPDTDIMTFRNAVGLSPLKNALNSFISDVGLKGITADNIYYLFKNQRITSKGGVNKRDVNGNLYTTQPERFSWATDENINTIKSYDFISSLSANGQTGSLSWKPLTTMPIQSQTSQVSSALGSNNYLPLILGAAFIFLMRK